MKVVVASGGSAGLPVRSGWRAEAVAWKAPERVSRWRRPLTRRSAPETIR